MKRRLFLRALGAAIAGPSLATAQQTYQLRRVAVLMSTAETGTHEQAAVAAFRQSLEQAGWVAGRNIEIALRWGNGDGERMAANAREIVGLAPDVIAVKGANLPYLAKLTTTIPIVFVFLSDAIAMHYVASLARPGGNITGFTSGERDLVGKRLQLLREIAPNVTRALYLRSEQVGADTSALYRSLVAAASGFTVEDGVAKTVDDIEPIIAAFARQPGGSLVVAFDAFNTTHAELIVKMAAKYRLPAIYPFRFFTDSGGLLSYGFDQDDQFRKAASYVDRLLKGAKPADLPVQEPTRFQLVINGKTATALGIIMPQLLLMQADEVIE